MTAAAGRAPRMDRLFDLLRRHPIVVDVGLALIVAALGVAWANSVYSPVAKHGVFSVVAVVASLPVVFRRRYPLPAAVATGAVVASSLLTVGMAGAEVPSIVMAYSVVVYGPAWAGKLMLAVVTVGGLLPILRLTGFGRLAELAFVLVAMLIAGGIIWLAGSLRRAQLRSEANERARRFAETRRQEIRLELLAERSRISREVHDIVAHSLSGIIAQADGGQFAASRDPDRAVQVLSGISTAGREALGDIRGLLAMLRYNAPVDDTEDATRPQPGTGDVPALVEHVRAGGLPVTLETTGTPHDLSTGAGLAAYRVVQEGLTNVVKHAGTTATTRVALTWDRDELTVTIRDEGGTGPRPALPRGGHGLVGMRERAALHGGTVETGPHPDGGFLVRLRLPHTPGPAPETTRRTGTRP